MLQNVIQDVLGEEVNFPYISGSGSIDYVW